ncbi:MAG: YigZ family protein [Thermomicrobiales bacterium]|nr:YigZ family protein [Thermomicrobiales bacterium]
MSSYQRTIARDGSHEIVVKKSRFICTLARVTSEAEARAAIDEVKKRHWDANHNCSAYRIGAGGRFQRTSDDGEPSGTAGVPMLEVLSRRDLIDVVAIVTRYFGGTLLGAGGLIRAYGQAVSAAVDEVGIVERRPVTLVEVEADYAEAGRLENALRATEFNLGGIAHGAAVTFEIRLDEHELPGFEAWLADATNGRGHARVAGEVLVEVPVP